MDPIRSSRRLRVLLPVALIVVLSLTSCGGGARLKAAEDRAKRAEAERDAERKRADDLEARLEALEASRSAAPTPTPTPASSRPTTSTPGAAKPKTVRQFAFITSMSRVGAMSAGTTLGYRLVADYAQFLTGEAAAKAATQAGKESPPPNDYFIVNENKRLRTLTVSRGATVKSIFIEGGGGDPANAKWVDIGHFYSLWERAPEPMRRVPYWLTIRDGVVVKIEEQFLP